MCLFWGGGRVDEECHEREQLSGVGSHLSPYGPWGLNSCVRLSNQHLYPQSHLTVSWLLLRSVLYVSLRTAEPQYLLEVCIMSELGFIYVIYPSIYLYICLRQDLM